MKPDSQRQRCSQVAMHHRVIGWHRPRRWSRLWGIRQFQFFGLPAITPTRELFRCEREGLPSEALRQAHDATKANDYAAYLDALQTFALRFSVDYSERPSARYPGETARRILGLAAGAVDLLTIAHLVTRTDEWRIQPRGADALTAVGATPWTRFNNSAPVDSIEVFDAAAASPERPCIRCPDRRRRRRPIGSPSRPTVPITPL